MAARSISLLLILCLLAPLGAGAQEKPAIQVPAAILMDAQTGEVYLAKNEHQPRSIASIVKTMTLLLAAELIQARKIKLGDVVTVSANAASRGGTQIRLKSGDKLTVEELMFATALVSANDAAVALAEYIGGTEKEFARLMRERAAALGLRNTSFVDATGLLPQSSGNYSTAYELAQLARFAMQNPVFARTVGTEEYFLRSQGRTLRNSNDLLFTFPGTEGVKTGLTTPAGHTLLFAASQDGWRLVGAVLGAKTREQRFDEARAILEWGFANLESILRMGEEIISVPVRDGARSRVTLVARRDLKTILPDDERRLLRRELDVPASVEAPLKQGDRLGQLIIFKGEKEVARVDLVAKNNVGRANIFTFLFKWLFDLLGLS